MSTSPLTKEIIEAALNAVRENEVKSLVVPAAAPFVEAKPPTEPEATFEGFETIALRAARRGFRVFPIRPDGKAACIKKFPELATTDENQIREWAQKFPDASVGLLATPDGNLFIDEDESEKFRQGYEDFAWPDTFPKSHTTEARKDHRQSAWLQTDYSRTKLRNITQGKTKDRMFSLRFSNLYVLGEGSRHPSGSLYRLVDSTPPQPIPDSLADYILSLVVETSATPGDSISVSIPTERVGDMTVPPQFDAMLGLHARNDGVSQYVWHLYQNETTDFDQLLELALAYNEKHCDPPLPETEIAAIVKGKMGKPVTGANAVIRPQPGPSASKQLIGLDGKEVNLASIPPGQSVEVMPLISVDGDKFMKENIPPRRALIQLINKKEPIFTEQSINQIFAWRGLGKTCLGLGLTSALARGGSFLNWEAPQRARVLYVEGELPAAQAQERWKQIVGPTEGYARLITIDKQTDRMIPSLATAIGMARIEKTLADLESQGFKVEVLILDSISTLFNITANDEEAWITIQAWLISLRSRGLCIFFFHHAGKSGLSRSHSKSEDMLDVSIKLDGVEDPEPNCLHVLMHYDKSRAGFSDPDAEIKMRRAHSPSCPCIANPRLIGCPGDSVRWERLIPGDKKRYEAEQRFRKGESNEAIAEELDIVPSTVRNWRKKWKDNTDKLAGI